MNGYVKVYTTINQLYAFQSGKRGHGYPHNHDNNPHWSFEILVPIDMIYVSDNDDSYLIKWNERR